METKYEALMAEAERLRIEEYKPEEAIEHYRQALLAGAPNDRAIKQMIGVCYQLKHDYEQALKWYEKAKRGATSFEEGNILRDMAESLSGMGEHENAERHIYTSMSKLQYLDHPSEYGASLGFLARIKLRRANYHAALVHFAVADAILHSSDNREMELYNKLHYASALSRTGHWWRARAKSAACLDLAMDYGAHQHRLRAIVLLFGGYRAEAALRNLRN